MIYIILGIAVVTIVYLISWYFSNEQKKKKAAAIRKSTMKPVKCPVCGSDLFVGENLVSKVYRPMNVPDQLMLIIGCPHCYPVCEPGVKRTCPVCKKPLAPDQALTARLFNKALGKKHVHIVGCSNCHKPRAQ